MTAIEYVGLNYDFFYDIARKIAKSKDKGEELLHFVIIYLHDRYNQDKLNEAIDEEYIKYYIINVMKVECYSKTSFFYRDYMKYFDKTCEEIKYEKSDCDVAINEIHKKEYLLKLEHIVTGIVENEVKHKRIEWWEGEVYKLYFFDVNSSFKDLEKKTRIPQTTCFVATKKVEKIINEKLKRYGEKI